MYKATSCARYEALVASLKVARIERGLSMRELADIIDEDHSYVYQLESMKKRLDISEFVQYCEALGVDPLDQLSVFMQVKCGP